MHENLGVKTRIKIMTIRMLVRKNLYMYQLVSCVLYKSIMLQI